MILFKEKEKRLANLNVKDIAQGSFQPRRSFDEYELYKLSESIRANGIIEPLTVRKTERGYMLISGERRLRAAKHIGLKKVPCVVVNVNGETAAAYSITLNLQRESLNFFEEAEGISRMLGDYGISSSEAAARLGISQLSLNSKLRILRFSNEERARIISAGLSERHARAIIKIDDTYKREKMLEKVICENMTAKECECFIERLLNPEIKEAESGTGRQKSGIADVRIFSNSLNRLVDTMLAAGIKASRKRQENKDYIEYRIRIPKQQGVGGEEESPQLKIC